MRPLRILGSMHSNISEGRPVTVAAQFSAMLPSLPLARSYSRTIAASCRRLSTRPAPRQLPKPITLTENAANRIKELTAGKEDIVGLRIGVRRRGCSGYSYNMNYVKLGDESIDKDELVRMHDVNVYVDPKAIFFIVGTEMDYVETDIASEFTFNNPNSKGECGCGESFNM